MVKPFMDDNFLLASQTAQTLYHEVAKDLPIIDYHCHLSPGEILENKRYRNLTELWLGGDHYKWRVMRAGGVEEAFITGDADDYDKFLAFAKVVPMTIGNPMYHWSHLELRRYFGVEELLNEETAPLIWEKVNAQLAGEGFGARDFIRKSGVEVICTTDDPTDSLLAHEQIKADKSFVTLVLPSFRPDKAFGIDKPTYKSYLKQLAEAAQHPIGTYAELLEALRLRVDYFHARGCRVSDHGLDYVPYARASQEEAAAIFDKAMREERITLHEEQQFKAFTLIYLGRLYAERGWVMQYHMNALRNNNTLMFERLGPDTGFDSINDRELAQPLARLLDGIAQAQGGELPRTILYSLHPGHNPVIASMIGNYQGGGIAGKVQFGSGWWFNDTKEGMLAQMKMLADMGLLSQFVGMLTDSRSFLSYTRHEYFRRIVCNLIGEWVENGEFPYDRKLLDELVQRICYGNARAYFPFWQTQ